MGGGKKRMTEEKENFDSGAVRSKLENVRYDLISPIALRRLASVYAYGASRYGDDNWRKGIPFSNLLNHAINHIIEWAAGNNEREDHLAHAFCNLSFLLEQEITHPELNDLFFHKKKRTKEIRQMLEKILEENCDHPEDLCGSKLPDGSYKCCACGKWLWFKK